jgi:transaldolase
MTLHVLEKLAATNPDCEIWFDSSPLVYASWKRHVLSNAPAEKRSAWDQQLTRFFDRADVEKTGAMGFRGVTTNPPLLLQAIQDDPDFWMQEIRRIALEKPNAAVEEIYWDIYLDVVRRGAAMIRPVWVKSIRVMLLTTTKCSPKDLHLPMSHPM